jgi:hypothetical protein
MTELVSIVATRHFCFFDRLPSGEIDRKIITAGTAEAFPKPVVDKAIAKGAAAMPGTAEAEVASRFSDATDHITMAHCVNLGDPLGVLPS